MSGNRKQYRRKRRACGLCHPEKRGFESRWKPREGYERRSLAQSLRTLAGAHPSELERLSEWRFPFAGLGFGAPRMAPTGMSISDE